ncbi:hypothetical protein [Stenomitos frigidus]|uniref:Uncharacterized protein n=1 Tax=Stenomitos frigidus ULC18 TaxID=2107698 RepID=A0A2T1E4J3_9CYAN|nr:hypothetical protein [Stenomitos frigidus]PSB27667.1 hypothetical protein C7B82_16175 [Stenomitos frigidus ULC18]
MTSPDVMQAIADRASTNPAYTQPIRVSRPLKPELSQCHKVCRTLAVFVCGVTAGVLLHKALEWYFPADYAPIAQPTLQRAKQ